MQSTTAKFNLNGEFSAADLEEIIQRLAIARASLAPPVPDEPPTEMAEDEMLHAVNPHYAVKTLVDGGLRIWLRNPGYGWISFQLSAADKAGLVEFVGKKAAHTHTSH